ncbi:MAG TPA: IPT/TIG domain-containing protein [Bacteroidales bacterium]|nr:IPT/TIG domain-containing protein [Bacteroidales bacterium]
MLLNACPSGKKHQGYLIILIFLVSILIKCEDETPVPREYPRISSTDIENISDSGAIFSADLYSLGNEKVIEHGFVWGLYPITGIEQGERIFLGSPQKTGVFNAKIRTTLLEGRDYYVKPFAKTESRFIYGPEAKFISLGSKAPVITGFSPDSAGWSDTISVYGRNFSWLSNEVFLNEVRLAIIKCTDTCIQARIESSVNNIENTVSVSVTGNKATYQKKKLRLIPPSIIDFYPKRSYWKDTITLTGKHIGYITASGNYVSLGSVKCSVSYAYLCDSIVKVIIPQNVNIRFSDVILKLNSFTLKYKDQFELNPPYFTISPKEGTWGSVLTLTGRFNPDKSRSTISFNNTPAVVSSVSETKMSVTVPDLLSDAKSVIKYTVDPFTVVSSDTFSIKPPLIETVTPVSGCYGTIVTIKGRDFGNSPAVSFGVNKPLILSYNDSVINARVPFCSPAVYNIKITNRMLTSEGLSEFTVTEGEWSKIQLASDLIWSESNSYNNSSFGFSVKGKGYLLPIEGYIYSFDPVTNTLNRDVLNSLGSGSSFTVMNDTCYIISNSSIYRFENGFTQIGTINYCRNGVAFSTPGYVYYGLSNDPQYYSTNVRLYKYNLKTGNSTLISNFPGSKYTYPIASQQINNKAYILFNDRSFYEYDPVLNQWNVKQSLPGSSNIYGTCSFVLNNNIYIGCGRNTASGGKIYEEIYSYDIAANNWQLKTTFPGEPRYKTANFVINGKAYIGFGLNSKQETLREINIYDPND